MRMVCVCGENIFCQNEEIVGVKIPSNRLTFHYRTYAIHKYFDAFFLLLIFFSVVGSGFFRHICFFLLKIAYIKTKKKWKKNTKRWEEKEMEKLQWNSYFFHMKVNKCSVTVILSCQSIQNKDEERGKKTLIAIELEIDQWQI